MLNKVLYKPRCFGHFNPKWQSVAKRAVSLSDQPTNVISITYS